MKTKLLSVILACALALTITGRAAYADTFGVSATFSDGGVLTGTLVLDANDIPTGNSTLVARTTLFFDPPPGQLQAVAPFFIVPPNPNYGPGFLTESGSPNYSAPSLRALLDLTFNSLVILSGSIDWPRECTVTGPLVCVGGTSNNIVSGSLTPVASVPLPTAFPLFTTGLGALGLLAWRRKRRA
jgi:hypothetical protein